MPAPAAMRHRFYGSAELPTDRTARPRAQYTAAPADLSRGGVATLRISEPIDSWGWPWGVSAADVQAVLDELPDDVTEVRVEINSPGGEATEGMAITNVLRNHPATVTAVVFGMAASAASVIAVSADETVMNPGSWLMIHNAWGIEIGEAKDMRSYADYLDKLSDNYADTYAAAAGAGTRAEWRSRMDDETWYLPDEAVAAGLAQRVGKVDTTGAPESAAAAARARFDLSMFAHAGRDQAPDPLAPARTQTPSTEPVQGNPTRKGDADMAFTDDVRTRLGITDEAATDETLLAALDEALAEQADDTGSGSAQLPEGVSTIDTAVLEELRASARRGDEARAQQEREQREALADAAVRDGRIARARRDHWVTALAADPGAAEQLAALQPGLVPVAEIGHDAAADSDAAPANSLAAVRESDAYKEWKL